MRKPIVVLLAAAVALGGCRRESARDPGAELVSVTGTVSGVKEREVRVTTDDGRVLEFPVDDAVEVTLGGGESRRAVITEGAPVRVSYRPRGDGAEVVSIDVEPVAPDAGRGSVGTRAEPPPAPRRAPEGASEPKPLR